MLLGQRATTQRPVKPHMGFKLHPLQLHERLLSGQDLTLGLQHFKIATHPGFESLPVNPQAQLEGLQAALGAAGLDCQ